MVAGVQFCVCGGQMMQCVAGVGSCMVSHTTGAVQQFAARVCGGQMKQWVCGVGVGCMAAAAFGGSQKWQCVLGVGFIPTAAACCGCTASASVAGGAALPGFSSGCA